MRAISKQRIILILWVCFCMSVEVLVAHDGDNPGAIEGDNQWKSFELITENDPLDSLALGLGYSPGDPTAGGTFTWVNGIHDNWDGLGAYLLDSNTLRVLVNHEGTDDATISAFEVNIDNLVEWAQNFPTETAWPGPGQVVTGIGNGFASVDTSTGGSGRNLETRPLSRLCSGNVWQANTFGAERGFTDRLFLTGEEDLTTNNAGGSIFVLDVATQILYEAPDVAPLNGRWENACIVDSGNTNQIAIVLSSDGASNQLYLYIGTKNTSPSANFLQRNGLVGGQVFQFDPAGSVTTLPALGSLIGSFALTTTEPLVEDKLEDVHTNPNDPTHVVLADQTDGIYDIGFNLQFNQNGTLDTNASSFQATLLDSANDNDGVSGGNLSAPDNLVWSANGYIYVNEDGSGDDVWQLDPMTGDVVRIANGFDTETSGVIDISSKVGFTPGSILLTTSYDGSSANGDNGACYMLVSPIASLLGDVNLDGTISLLDVGSFVALLTNVSFQIEADINGDGVVDLLDVQPFVDLLSGA